MVLSEGVQLYIRNAEFAFNSGKLLEVRKIVFCLDNTVQANKKLGICLQCASS